MTHGLPATTVAKIHTIFAQHGEIEKAILYGSRAKGNYKPGSDIDLTLVGEQLQPRLLNRLETELDELLLPYTFDLSLFSQIVNQELISHIERAGQIFYQRSPPPPRVPS